MKKKYKITIRNLFIERLVTDYGFEPDNDPMLGDYLICARKQKLPYWIYLALSVSRSHDKFYVEAAITMTPQFPSGEYSSEPPTKISNKVVRLRIADLWGDIKHNGWRLSPEAHLTGFEDLSPEERVFKPKDAIDDVFSRLDQWVFPYFDALLDSCST